MAEVTDSTQNRSPIRGVMFNAYPDSIGSRLSDTLRVLELEEFRGAFSLFYILPTFFNSDLDRGFSIIDYNMNQDLVSPSDLEGFHQLGISLKFDIVLNHLSVGSPQFQDMLQKGDASPYKDFFIDWNEFWKGHGSHYEDGVLIPNSEYLEKLFMRKSGLPVLKVFFPDGSERPYWNTFYQKISYPTLSSSLVASITGDDAGADRMAQRVNDFLITGSDLVGQDWKEDEIHKQAVVHWLNQHRSYLGQMDVNAKSPLVWKYYEEVLNKLASYGCKIVRLDAFAYLHKEVGSSNFFNKPGTWDYLSRIQKMAVDHGLLLLPEIHAEYGLHLHDEVAAEGYVIYDFFLPGLLIHALETANSVALMNWGREIVEKGFKTVNMLGCHDGIPVLDLRGKEVNGVYQPGLLSDEEIEHIMEVILQRGGRVKNLYGADGKKISYYQVNATYYSALGENDDKMILARAIQMFMPGIPQVWYLDIFAGKNDYDAIEKAGKDGHKEINRSSLPLEHIRSALSLRVVQKQLELIRFRNNHPAFDGQVVFSSRGSNDLTITWRLDADYAILHANLINLEFTIESSGVENIVNLS